MNTFTKEICLSQFDSMCNSLRKTDDYDLRLFYLNKTEGFLLGIFYADVINEKEFKELNTMISNIFWRD